MDSKIMIPGLGHFSNADVPPAQISNAVTNGAEALEVVEPAPDTEMTTAEDTPSRVHAQTADKAMDGAQIDNAVIQSVTAEIIESDATAQPSDLPSELVSSEDLSEDVKMDDGQNRQKNTTIEQATAEVVVEAPDTEMGGSEVHVQQALEVQSRPASPPVTHALEAALEGLLGAAEDPVSTDTAPTNGGHVNPTEAKDPSTVADQVSASVTALEGEAEPVEGHADANPEWEADSSPYESSSSSSSDDSSDGDSDVEASNLGIAETARLLMEADGGSDEEIDGARAAKQAATVRTKNEQPDEPEPKPEITIDAADTVLPLGIVQHIVEGTHVVIEALLDGGKATIFDRGTVLCKEDRTVLGVVHDTIATVHKPMYILKCSSEEELKTAGLERGTQIWYAKAHAVFVFPAQLEKEKGSDASNLYDEEVGPEEMEYSDDEQEQAHKREKKNKKRGTKGGGGRGNKFSRGDDNHSRASVNGDAGLRYEDDDDGPYKPLSRPANFGMGLPPPPPPPASMSPHPPVQGTRGGHQQGRRGDSRGRGGRGRGFNGRGRGGHGQSSPLATRPVTNNYLPPPPFAANTSPMPGQWPFPIPPMPHFGGAAPANPNTSNYPMPNWGAGQPSPFPFTPVPPPNWPNAALQAPQQTNYTPPTGGYNMPAVPYPPGGAANAAVPPPPPPNYQQYQNYYGNGQPSNNQSQQRWG